MSRTAPPAAAGRRETRPGTTATPGGAPHGTGFCRVTIVAPDSRIDVALPEDIPVADIHPEILRLSGQTPAAGEPVGYHLVRRDGTVLDGSRSFAAQRVLDGEVLSLRPFAESLPPAVFDDVSDAVASAVSRDRTLWDDRLTRTSGLTGGAVLLVLAAFALWSARPVATGAHGLPAVLAGVMGLALLTLAAVRARVYADRAASLALGLGALPHVLLAGAGLLPPAAGHGPGRLQLLLGCVAVLLASVVLTIAAPSGDGPFTAALCASTVGTAAVFLGIVFDLSPERTAALCAPFAVGVLAFLPGLSARFARLPVGYEAPGVTPLSYDTDPDATPETHGPVDAERIAARARRGHETLVGLVGGCAAVVLAASAVLAFSHSGWALLLALATGLALLLRARLFRYTAQAGALLAAGFGTLTLLGAGVAASPSALGGADAADLRTVWLTAAIAGAAAVLTAIALIVPSKGLTPFWGRFLEIFETFVLLTLLPLCLAVLDVYSAARSLTSG
ncbi:type VII secretion integral membrane protein EccD [Streptomyces sp. AJS327]|uniref:type VII secretion integral membrane protein EccD n=1 Tax=Streptomyces sp. AJS327 TaxID=2545265 RepID=UPI0015E03C96|nr:type VII secretion integral membrane protein EccD [Streptomyces sp. AJS327]MBA0051892.1 type VII secretion integral membrane protein EccD [Streptomyces sp. AJS327]